MFTIHCKYSISHLLIDVHLYKFFTCLDINKICLKQGMDLELMSGTTEAYKFNFGAG